MLWQSRMTLLTQSLHNSATCFAVAVWVNGFAHLFVCGCIFEKRAYFADNQVMIGAHKMNSTALECLRTFGGVTHDENGFAQSRSFFLDTSGVGEDDSRFFHQIDKLQILQRFDEEEIRTGEVFAEHLVSGASDTRSPHPDISR